MKLYVHAHGTYTTLSRSENLNTDAEGWQCIGTIEVTEPKKIVTKEGRRFLDRSLGGGEDEVGFIVPSNAENVRCLYEVRE
jgi:hypothetical protein